MLQLGRAGKLLAHLGCMPGSPGFETPACRCPWSLHLAHTAGVGGGWGGARALSQNQGPGCACLP
jgi:hypothetical protein